MRRVYLRRHPNILKRLLVHVAAFNLGLVMRKLFGKGTPRGLQGYNAAALFGHFAAPERGLSAEAGLGKFHGDPEAFSHSSKLSNLTHLITAKEAVSTTGC